MRSNDVRVFGLFGLMFCCSFSVCAQGGASPDEIQLEEQQAEAASSSPASPVAAAGHAAAHVDEDGEDGEE